MSRHAAPISPDAWATHMVGPLQHGTFDMAVPADRERVRQWFAAGLECYLKELNAYLAQAAARGVSGAILLATSHNYPAADAVLDDVPPPNVLAFILPQEAADNLS